MGNSRPRLRVFISSTFRDLQPYRQAVFTAIHRLGGYSDDMIYWSADERSGAETSVERVKQCDVLILILAHRYGYVPEGSPYSVTEMEYRTAREASIPVLAFFVDESIPWPPDFVEWDRREELKRFKDKVRQEVTLETFNSPEGLAASVAPALALFMERHQQRLAEARRFTGRTLQVVSRVQLKTQPDAVVQIGLAEDHLPQLFEVRRAQDLSLILDHLAARVTDQYGRSPDALINNFRQSLEAYAVTTWSSQRLWPVQMQDGAMREMLISEATLSQLFQSALARLFQQARGQGPEAAEPPLWRARAQPPGMPPPPLPYDPGWSTDEQTAISIVASSSRSHEIKELQSVGGTNRFLGLSLEDNTIYSVGQRGGGWVEWRPFVAESLPANFPDGYFVIGVLGERFPAAVYPQTIYEYALRATDPEGRVALGVRFGTSRQAIGQLVLKIARLLADWHARGTVHGDLKPRNILLTANGPLLIDAFEDLAVGELSPGWTPAWSAPEQVIGESVTPATDVYPLGRMLAELLGGRLVGEVRRFRTPPMANGRDEFDVFYNPSVYVPIDGGVVNGDGLKAWRSLINACLRFDPARRPASAAEFSTALESLLAKHPLQGEVELDLPADLVAATLPDGSDTVARLVGSHSGWTGAGDEATAITMY